MSKSTLSASYPSHWRDVELIAITRKKIEEGITEHNRAVVEMKIRLNTLISVSCLPTEILSEIFLHYVHAMLLVDSSSSCQFSIHHRRPLNYLRISHVCHHWREIALNSPRLWSDIDVGPLRVTQEFLTRSKAASLIVNAYHSRVSSDSLLQVIEAFPRIQELNLYLLPSQYAQFASIFPKGATRLREVTLTNPSSTSNFPSLFDKCALPSLRALCIDGYSVFWPHPIFVSTLTRLVVRAPGTRNVSIDKVLDVLQNLQDLQYLELSQLGSLMVEPDGQLPHTSRQVTLPKIASLHLTHEISVCAYTLRQLVIPSSATLALQLNYATAMGEDIPLLVPVVCDKLSGNGALGPPLPILSAGLWQDRFGGPLTKLCCWREHHFDDLADPPDQPDFLLSFNPFNVTIGTILKHFGSMIPGEEVITFCMQGDGPYSGPVRWSDALETMPNIESLHTLNMDAGDLMKILSPLRYAEGEDVEDVDFLLQDLNFLKISDMVFPYGDDGVYLGSLIENLLSRQEVCIGVVNLEIRRCANFSQSDVEKLASIVDNVEWDRLETVQADEDSEEDSEYMVDYEHEHYDDDEIGGLDYDIYGFW